MNTKLLTIPSNVHSVECVLLEKGISYKPGVCMLVKHEDINYRVLSYRLIDAGSAKCYLDAKFDPAYKFQHNLLLIKI